MARRVRVRFSKHKPKKVWYDEQLNYGGNYIERIPFGGNYSIYISKNDMLLFLKERNDLVNLRDMLSVFLKKVKEHKR
jgi:hypothetical protein